MVQLKLLYQGRSDRPVVVFLHGLGGHWIDTWRHPKTSVEDMWLHWVGQDSQCDVWTLQYDAAISAWVAQAMPITDQGDQVADLLATEPGLKGKRLILVGHSMGGLVIKALIVQGRTKSDERIRDCVQRVVAVSFLATPHNGSQLAGVAQALSGTLRTNRQVDQMKAHDPMLRQLNQQFRNARSEMNLQVRVFVETQDVTLTVRLLGIPLRTVGVRVVDPSSSDPGLEGVTATPMAGDHFSICKPRGRQEHIHKSLCDFVAEVTARQAAKDQPEASNASQSPQKEPEGSPPPHANAAPTLEVDLDRDFVGGIDAVRRFAMTLLEPSWDGTLKIECAWHAKLESELQALRSLSTYSQEQGARIVELRDHVGSLSSTVARLIVALKSTFIASPGKERHWGVRMTLEFATGFIANLFGRSIVALGTAEDRGLVKCSVYFPVFSYRYRVVAEAYIPEAAAKKASDQWFEAMATSRSLPNGFRIERSLKDRWGGLLPVLAFDDETIASHLLPVIVNLLVPNQQFIEGESAQEFRTRLAHLKPPESGRDPLDPFDWCVALEPSLTRDEIIFHTTEPPKSTRALKEYIKATYAQADP